LGSFSPIFIGSQTPGTRYQISGIDEDYPDFMRRIGRRVFPK